jgi:pimeloyl-ACP methyl ester carboxylesterase
MPDIDEILTFTDVAGHKVVGVLSPPSQATDSVAVLCHGFLSNKNSATNKALTALLVPQGIATFRFDFFGHGESAGPFEDLTIRIAVSQAISALDLMYSRGYRKVGLVGSSFGGLVAVLAAAEWNSARSSALSALALKCPVSDFAEMLRGEFDEKTMAKWRATGTIPNVAGGDGRIRLPFSFYEECTRSDAYQAARAVDAPTLIIHGDCDEYVPLAQSRRLAAALSGKASLLVLPGADHFFSTPAHFREMTTLISQWMVDHLNIQTNSTDTRRLLRP